MRCIVRELNGQEVLAGLSERNPRHFLGRPRNCISVSLPEVLSQNLGPCHT